MNSIKSLIMMLALGAVGYGVYKTLHEQHIVRATPGIDTSTPEVDLEIGKPIQLPSNGLTVAPPPERMTANGSTTQNLDPPPLNAFSSAPPSIAPPPLVSSPSNNSLAMGPGGLPSPTGVNSIPDPVAHDFQRDSLALNNSVATASNLSAVPPQSNPLSSPTPIAPAPSLSLYSQMREQLKPLLAQRKLFEALQLASQLYDNISLMPNEQQELQELLNQLAGTVIYSREHWVAQPYVVAAGDTFESVAQKYQIPAILLAKINGTANQNPLQPGEQLKVLQGPFSAEINLSKKRITLFLSGCYAGSFDLLSLGTETRAYNERSFKIMHKTDNVIYRTGNIPAGDPKNPLGNYLLGLSDDIAIHGVGSEVAATDPRGSIRLSARDAEDVYDILSLGSSVTIKR